MTRKSIMGIAIMIVAATLLQGCALIYIEDKNDNNEYKVKEIGVLGGCIPIFSYRSQKPAKAPEAPENTAHNAADAQ